MKRFGLAAVAAVLATALAATVVLGQQGGDNNGGQQQQQQPEKVFGVVLQPVNDSGVQGTATIYQMPDGTLRTDLTATNLTKWQMHPQHIHGNPGGSAAECPTSSLDENDDGIVDFQESLSATGQPVLPLNQAQFPVAGNEGSVVYHNGFNIEMTPSAGTPGAGQTGTPQATNTPRNTPTSEGTEPSGTSTPQATPAPIKLQLQNLTDGVVVVHGMMVNREYQATVPVACGQIQVCPIQGGASGSMTATDTPTKEATPSGTPSASGTPTPEMHVTIPPACPPNVGTQAGTPQAGGAEGTPSGTMTPSKTKTPSSSND